MIEAVREPLQVRTEVPLPRTTEHPELRAWDAMLFGEGKRTGIECEMRIHDGQDLERRIHLKLRDDPVDHVLLAVADTAHNRRIVADNPTLLSSLPRLSRGDVLKSCRAGKHPPSGLFLL